MAGLALMALILIVGRAAFVYHHPLGRCRWCGGRGTNLFSTKRRYGPCPRCGGAKAMRRADSRFVHRMVRGTGAGATKGKRL
jgi:hypothetical protein